MKTNQHSKSYLRIRTAVRYAVWTPIVLFVIALPSLWTGPF